MIITGTNGNDSGATLLLGTNQADVINGLAGMDQLFGRGGNDILVGGPGDDFIDGGSGLDTVSYAYGTGGYFVDLNAGHGFRGASDYDHLSSIENVWGSNFWDVIKGSDVANELTGRGGTDTLAGRGGADSLSGGSGDDTLLGGAGADWVFGGTGIDVASYAESSTGVLVSLSTGKGVAGDAQGDLLDGIENLVGSYHADLLIGNGDSNRLSGWDGDDILQAGDGADFLSGGAGKDTLTGGNGADIFHVAWWGDLPSSAIADAITDFDSTDGDKIDVTIADLGSSQTCEFIGTAQFTDGHQVQSQWMAGATMVEVSGYDASVATTIQLEGIHLLGASDFIL